MKQIDKQIEIKTPIELLQFFDEYFNEMSAEDVHTILNKVVGATPRILFEGESTDYTLSEAKLRLGVTLIEDFIKGKPIFKSTILLDKKYIDVLNRETTPEQIEYLRWLWKNKQSFMFRDSDYENIEHPDHIKAYLLSEDY